MAPTSRHHARALYPLQPVHHVDPGRRRRPKLTSHHHVHPVRRTVGLLLLAAVVIALLIATWQQTQLADRVEASFGRWLDRTDQPMRP